MPIGFGTPPKNETNNELTLGNKLKALFKENEGIVEIGRTFWGQSLSQNSGSILKKWGSTKGWLTLKKTDKNNKGDVEVDVWEVTYTNEKDEHQPSVNDSAYRVYINPETEELHPNGRSTGAFFSIYKMHALYEDEHERAQEILNEMKDKINQAYKFNLG